MSKQWMLRSFFFIDSNLSLTMTAFPGFWQHSTRRLWEEGACVTREKMEREFTKTCLEEKAASLVSPPPRQRNPPFWPPSPQHRFNIVYTKWPLANRWCSVAGELPEDSV